MQANNDSYDAIVIGSGIGGLTAAALLAKAQGKRVLVLERHWLPGGQTHVFKRRGGYRWDVGLHYVGDMAPGSDARAIMDYITDAQVQWQRQPGGVDRFEYPGLSVRTGENFAEYRANLERQFPAQTAAITHYFHDLERAQKALAAHWTSKMLPPLLSAPVAAWNRLRYRDLWVTTESWLRRNVPDPKLRAVLASRWGDYGLVPRRSAFLTHAMVCAHYRDGAWYPVGGSSRLAQAIIPVIEAAGGRVQTQTAVDRILVERGHACGVAARRLRRSGPITQTWRAPLVISSIGAYGTFHGLLAEQPMDREREETQRLSGEGDSAVTLYLGLRTDPASLGFSGENCWLYSEFEHRMDERVSHDLLAGRASFGFLSFPSMKDPQAKAHTAEVVVHCPWAPFARWRNTPWRKRGTDYEALKERISQGILDLLERRYPGFRDLVAYHELSTPLTQAYFTGHVHGGFYGVPATLARYRATSIGPRTRVPGCLQAGTDAVSLGIVGAMMGGVMAAATNMGRRGFPLLMERIRNHLRSPPTS